MFSRTYANESSEVYVASLCSKVFSRFANQACFSTSEADRRFIGLRSKIFRSKSFAFSEIKVQIGFLNYNGAFITFASIYSSYLPLKGG